MPIVLIRIVSVLLLVTSTSWADPDTLKRLGRKDALGAIAGFKDLKFTLTGKDVVVFVGQENLVRDQKAGEMEALLASGFQKEKPRFRSMAWEADTVY
jgi:hypothetical protein